MINCERDSARAHATFVSMLLISPQPVTPALVSTFTYPFKPTGIAVNPLTRMLEALIFVFVAYCHIPISVCAHAMLNPPHMSRPNRKLRRCVRRVHDKEPNRARPVIVSRPGIETIKFIPIPARRIGKTDEYNIPYVTQRRPRAELGRCGRPPISPVLSAICNYHARSKTGIFHMCAAAA